MVSRGKRSLQLFSSKIFARRERICCSRNEGFVPKYLGVLVCNLVSRSRTVLAGNFPFASRGINLQMHDLVSDGNFRKLVMMTILYSRERFNVLQKLYVGI